MVRRQTLGLLAFILLISAKAFSYDFKVDGLCYNILSDNTVELTWEAVETPYTGNIVIPSDVNYNSKRYDVVAIGDYAMVKVNSVDDSGVKNWGGNSKLSSVSLPSTILTIGNSAFWGCSGLTSITIPNSVTSIGNWAFQGCSGLTSITIPNTVTSIGGCAFLWCDNLTSITIPNSVIIIGEWAFNGCSGLTSVISEIQNPFETKENVFSSGTYNKTTLTVPKGKKSAYQSTNYWKKFSKIVESTLEANDDLGKVADVVDLGLSVKWASWNIGASKPEEYGSYFSWGETTPKTNYAWSTYKFGNPPSKYNSTDNKKTLDASDDAAVVLWGGKWRMPTNDEEKELYQKCSWKYTELNGINGYQITGPSGNSIFLPAAGLYDGNDYVASANNRGWYWSSSSSRDSYALGLYFGSSDVYYSDVGHDKCDGHVIRPVYDDGSNQGQITVTAKNYTREYGDANPTFEYTVSGGSLSGTPKITCSATKTSSVGIYTIKIEKGSVTSDNVTFVDGTVTVTKAPLTITANSYIRKKGEANPTFEVTYSGFKNGETESVLTNKPTISCYATASSPAGTYDITASGAQAQNYDISYVKGTLTITEATNIIVKARDYFRDYGDANPTTFEYTVSGGSINGTPKITCSATKTTPEGIYTIKIEKGSVTNDNVTFINGTLRIRKAPLTIKANSYTREIGQANPTFEVTYKGFKNGETESVLTKKPTISCDATPNSKVGMYTIKVSGAKAQNYEIYYDYGMLTITEPKKIVVTAYNSSREYGKANPTFGYSVSGGTLSGTPKVTCTATKTSAVGTYTIKIEKGSVTNSNVTFVDGTLTVTKVPLTITAKSYTREKGEANPTFEVTYSGFKNGETEDVLTRKPTVSCSATTSSNVGTYDITVSGAQAQNYNIYYINGTLTVTEENKVRFTKDGITYACTTSTSSAIVEVVDNSLQIVEIPASVTCNGNTYQVTSLTNGIFAGRTFDYVSLPSTITSIENATFSNSTLGALMWNADRSLSPSVFSYMAMPVYANFLLYVNSQSYAPSNVANVVVGSTAKSITLSDATNTRFYCPKPFTAGTVSYTHTYKMETGGNGKGWETIALPFNVQKIEHDSKRELTPFYNYQDEATQRPFWLYELGSSGFRRASAIKANTPYIISMPNDTKYDSEYILTGNVTFSASNATIKETDSLEMPSSNGKRFVPAFSVVEKSSSVFALNVSNSLVYNSSSYDDGSRFVSNLRQVYPFEAYMTSNSAMSKTISIEFENGATGIDEVLITGEGRNVVKVYSIDGQLLIDSKSVGWKSRWQLLPAGVYIVNGRKVLVK